MNGDGQSETRDAGSGIGPSGAEQESLYGALFHLLPSSVVLLDLSGHVRDVNPAFCRWMGFSREELVGVHVSRFSADSPKEIARNLARMLDGEILDHEVVNRQKDGSLRHYEIRERAVDLPDGTRGILVVANDVTERKNNEAQRLELERSLLRSQNIESLGVLAGGIAHDFNNLLTVILGNVDFVASQMAGATPLRESLDAVGDAAKRAAELTRQMLAYSGRGRFITRRLSLGDLVGEALRDIRLPSSSNARLEFEDARGTSSLLADPNQLAQVLKSLVANAVEALPEAGGTISVSVTERDFDEVALQNNRTDQPVSPGRYVELKVADNGSGMIDEVRQRIFEPFFSTKFAGRGLGMAAVLGIARGHRAGLFVESSAGKGTAVRVLFPAAAPELESLHDGPAAAFVASRQTPCPLPGGVLLADDEDGVRVLMENLLREMGLTVLVASTGEKAVEIFQRRSAEISFAILDLTMHGISGVETLARLRRIRPDIIAVLTSGYPREAIESRGDGEGFVGFIQKPYEIAAFRAVVETVIAKLPCARPSGPAVG